MYESSDSFTCPASPQQRNTPGTAENEQETSFGYKAFPTNPSVVNAGAMEAPGVYSDPYWNGHAIPTRSAASLADPLYSVPGEGPESSIAMSSLTPHKGVGKLPLASQATPVDGEYAVVDKSRSGKKPVVEDEYAVVDKSRSRKTKAVEDEYAVVNKNRSIK